MKANGRRKVRVAAIADLHVHKVHRGEYRALFADLSDRADVLCLCGDLTNHGLPEEADHLAADLAALRIPAVAVLGNHDHHAGRVEEMKAPLRKANVVFLDDETFTLGDVGFAGTKGFGGGFGTHMLAAFGEEATKHFVSEAVNEALALESDLRTLSTPRTVVVLHYSPTAETVRGEAAEIQPFLGCSRIGETIDRFDSIAAVFHGHAHHGAPRGKTQRGVPVYNCSMDLLKRGETPYVLIEV